MNYVLFHSFYKTGSPLWCTYETIAFINLQVGNALLVRPVTDAGAVSADVMLPKGSLWYNYFTGKPMESGVQHTGRKIIWNP